MFWFQTEGGQLYNLARADRICTRFSFNKEAPARKEDFRVLADYGPEAYRLVGGLSNEGEAKRVVDRIFRALGKVEFVLTAEEVLPENGTLDTSA